MTMVFCQTCSKDVHITADCVTDPDHSVVTPPGLRGPQKRHAEEDE